MTTPVLQLDGITVLFGGVIAVNEVSITVDRGERLAVIGPNGAGKTTLFKTISGEQPVTAGGVRMFGHDVTALGPNRRARLGLGRTYQITSLFPDLTVAENVTLALLAPQRRRFRFWWPLRMSGAFAERVDEALDRVRLLHRRDDIARELSHGEQRQLEVGLALASDPDLLILDEPAAGLSGAERQLLTSVVTDLPTELTVVFIEHDIDLVFSLADRVICMDNGVVIEEGAPAEIRASDRVQAVYLGVE